jgi:hypothetical protein
MNLCYRFRRCSCGAKSLVVVLIRIYLHELLGHEDGVPGQGRTMSHPKGYVGWFPKIMYNQCMEAHFKHGDVACTT